MPNTPSHLKQMILRGHLKVDDIRFRKKIYKNHKKLLQRLGLSDDEFKQLELAYQKQPELDFFLKLHEKLQPNFFLREIKKKTQILCRQDGKIILKVKLARFDIIPIAQAGDGKAKGITIGQGGLEEWFELQSDSFVSVKLISESKIVTGILEGADIASLKNQDDGHFILFFIKTALRNAYGLLKEVIHELFNTNTKESQRSDLMAFLGRPSTDHEYDRIEANILFIFTPLKNSLKAFLEGIPFFIEKMTASMLSWMVLAIRNQIAFQEKPLVSVLWLMMTAPVVVVTAILWAAAKITRFFTSRITSPIQSATELEEQYGKWGWYGSWAITVVATLAVSLFAAPLYAMAGITIGVPVLGAALSSAAEFIGLTVSAGAAAASALIGVIFSCVLAPSKHVIKQAVAPPSVRVREESEVDTFIKKGTDTKKIDTLLGATSLRSEAVVASDIAKLASDEEIADLPPDLNQKNEIGETHQETNCCRIC